MVYIGQPRTVRLKNASEALKRFHLGEKEYYYPWQLSGGQQQRAAIARAIVSNPEIILADEPTGNLDSATGDKIEKLLFDLNKEKGITLIIVTHDEELAAKCKRQIRIADGAVVSDKKKGAKK